ncbi:YcbK family protein [Massilia terrae]|uniref:Murein endopeptidase K n=1 Tax=Massilia terrae TaxID=1811224 RepID=A0ABT2D4G1_9BURK|nr:DUF882 domain-containing protein [Massilia terrae]MCS0661009.1 DUF882 domain-containing protein [Massilia terrae]
MKTSAVLASTLGLPALARSADVAAAAAATASPTERSLRLYNIHTGESLKTTFWAEGLFVPDALQDINKLLRDYRNNKVEAIDPQLLFLLNKISAQFGSQNVLHVISGYRSSETNAMLHANTEGVAKHSLHMEGKAIDIRMPGQNLASLHKTAMAMRAGGVGYYPDSNFVHVDTGRVRYW